VPPIDATAGGTGTGSGATPTGSRSDTQRETGTGTTRVSSSTATSRSARRRARTATVVKPQSFLERYRNVLLILFAIIGVGVIALVFYQSAAAKPYVCDSLLTPGPVETNPPVPSVSVAPSVSVGASISPSPAAAPAASPSVTASGAPAASGSGLPVASASPATSASPAGSTSPAASASAAATGSPAGSASPAASVSPAASGSPSESVAPSESPSPTPVPNPTARLGFSTEDLGRQHVANGTTVTYSFCPPTSGNHYNQANPPAPLPRNFYGPDTSLRPQQWIHNMEHGYVVVAYKGTPDQATLDSIKKVLDTATGDAFATSCGQPNRVIAVRFDTMDTPYAVLAWDRALLLPEWDFDKALEFANQWQDNPAIPENPAMGAGIC
jgi:hypothetical protein